MPAWVKGICSLLVTAALCGLAHSGTLPGAPNCPLFPANNVWNADISALPVDPNSNTYISNMSPGTGLHPDFGSFAGYGIPYNVVSSAQAKVSVDFSTYGYPGESDSGPYPFPATPKIEGNDQSACNTLNGGDCHVLIVDKDACILYETWLTSYIGGQWHAGSGAIWSLNSNALRTDGWTSGDAAGLPILPGLVRYDEIVAGTFNHAFRFTMQHTTNAHIYPARHDARNSSNPLPMGLRVRLKAAANLSGLGPQALAIAHAMQKYGLILADNGSNWYISGASDPSLDDNDLHTLNQLHGSDFEVVDTSGLTNGPDTNTRVVNVGQGGMKYVDTFSNTSTTVVPVNATVQWNWVANNHSTTSGSCPGGVCSADGHWDSQVNNTGNDFTQVFNTIGTFPYFCSVHRAAMQGTVIVGDYGLGISSPLQQTVFAGQLATYQGTLTGINGYNNPVNLTCGPGHPPVCSPSASPVNPTAPFTISAADTAPNDYTFKIQGTSADGFLTTRSQSVTLHVVDFNITAPTPATLSTPFSSGGATTSTASFQVSASGSAFSGTVNLSCSGLPAGATCNFLPSAAVNFPGPGSHPVTASITVPGNTPAGTYNVLISANTAGAPAAKTQNLTLQVMDFIQGVPSTASLQMTPSSVSPPITFQLSPIAGFNAPITLTCSNIPGVSCAFSPAGPVTVSTPITETLVVTTNGAAVGTPTLTIRSSATMGGVGLNHSQSLPLNITAGSTTTDLSVTSVNFLPDPVEAKGPLSVTVVAHNAQTGADASNVTVGISFSQTIQIITATLPAGCAANSGVVTCVMSTPLTVGSNVSYTIQAVPNSGRNMIITATVSSPSVNDTNTNNNDLTTTAHIRFKPLARRGLVPRIP